MNAEEIRALVRESVDEIWNKGNLAAIDKVYAADYVDHDPSSPEPTRGREGVRKFITMYHSAFPDLRISMEDMVCDGDKVVSRWVARGTHKGDLMGIAPTGKFVTTKGISVARISGGLIAEEWENYDALGMLQQLGVVPSPG